MKRIFIIFFAILAIYQVSNAQTPINNPIVHVMVNSTNTGAGTLPFWLDAITIDQFRINLYNGVYSGNISVYFAGGDYYYAALKFWGVPSIVQSIKLYGGFDPLNYSAYGNLSSRDFVNHETRFHGKGENVIWFEAVGYNHPNGWNTCIVDGITITSDGYLVDVQALRLVGGNHIISQCKFENFNTSNLLIWLETGGNTVTFTNCLFDNNDVAALMALCTHANLINVTIADNTISNDMFIPYCSYNQFTQTYDAFYNYNLYNSIIYGNSNMYMEYDLTALHNGFFNVSNSILGNNEGWVNDMGYNYFSIDPEFTYNTVHPYTCNTSISPAIGNGNSTFILLCPFYDGNIMNYDVINAFRYGSNPLIVDIGAYQHSLSPNRQKKGRNNHSENSSIQLWASANTLYVNDVKASDAKLSLYNTAGQFVYSTALQATNNTIPLTLNSGIYVAIVTSKEGIEISSEKIVIP